MGAKVTWNGKMSFTGTADTGFSVPLDSSPAVGGDNSGFRPMELLAVSLAGCTAMDVISILRKKRQDVTAFEVKIHSKQAEDHPKVYTELMIEYYVEGRGVDPAAVERAIELSATKYCPVQQMLNLGVKIDHTYEIVEVEASVSPSSAVLD
jgi:putative redox protein